MSKYANIGHAFQCALGFLILFIAFNSTQVLQAKIMEQNGFGKLGNYNLAAVSITCVLGAFASTTFIKRFGLNVSLVIGALGDTQWVLCSVLPAKRSQETDPYKLEHDLIYQEAFIYTVMIISSCICGFTTGIIWTAQGCYNAQCATEETKGFYFSFFWTIYTLSMVLGNALSALILGNMNELYFYIMSGVAASSCFIFGTLRKPKKIRSNHLNHNNDDNEEQKQQTFLENIKGVWVCATQKRMLLFLPENGWTGVSISFFTSMLVPIITATIATKDPDPQIRFHYFKSQCYFSIVIENYAIMILRNNLKKPYLRWQDLDLEK